MSSADLAAWISVAIGVASLVVAVVALRKASTNSTKIRNLETEIFTLHQVAIHRPVMMGGAGGGGGGGAGGQGGGVAYQPTQSSGSGHG